MMRNWRTFFQDGHTYFQYLQECMQVPVSCTITPRTHHFPTSVKCSFKYQTMSSSQDGGIGRYTLPPCTTQRRITTNLKTKINQNSQKIELHESPITKDVRNIHPDWQERQKWTAGMERMHSKEVADRPGGPTVTCR